MGEGLGWARWGWKVLEGWKEGLRELLKGCVWGVGREDTPRCLF